MTFLYKPDLEDNGEPAFVLLGRAKAQMFKAYRNKDNNNMSNRKQAIDDWDDFMKTLDKSSDDTIRAALKTQFNITTKQT